MIKLLYKEIAFPNLRCKEHSNIVKEQILNVIIERFSLSACTHINQLLKGKLNGKILNLEKMV